MSSIAAEVAAIRAEFNDIQQRFGLIKEAWELRQETEAISSDLDKLAKQPAAPVSVASSAPTKSLSLEETVVENLIERITANDPSTTEVKIVSFPDATPQTGVRLATSLLDNTHVTSVTFVNAKVTDEGAKKFGEVLAKNTTLTFLNLETNMIGGDGVSAIAVALAKNETLLDLKLSNQSKQAGSAAELKLAEAFQTNKTLQKINLPIKDATARGTIDRAIVRNQELARQARRNK